MKKTFFSLLAALFVFVSYSQNTEKDCQSAKNKYLQQNPDVANARIDAWTHYDYYGRKEGRKWPNCDESSQNNNNNTNFNFENFHKRFLQTNSLNSIFNKTIYSYPPNPPESFYKKDYYNNKIIYDGYVKQVVTGNSGNQVYKNEFKHGRGKEYFINSNGYYDGFFVNGKLSGYGLHISDGYSYKGYFVGGEKNGEAVIVSDGLNGTTKYVYEGSFSNNRFNGKGLLIYDFMAFMGEFINGEMNVGTAYYPNGKKYVGKFSTGKYHGYGEYFWGDGNVYKGDFRDGNFHGNGELKYSNGTIQKGLFEGGNFKGLNIITKQNDSNLSSNIIQKSNSNKFPDSKFQDLKIDGRTIKSKLEKMFLDLYSKAFAMHTKNSLLNKSTTEVADYLENGILELKHTVDGWLGGPMTDLQVAEFLAINKTTMNEVTSSMGLVSAVLKNSGSSSPGSKGASYSSNSISTTSNSTNNSVCSMCKPYDAKGHYIKDFDPSSRTYKNGRYIKRPGYKPCNTCKATGTCLDACRRGKLDCPGVCGDNDICAICHGDRFELCSRCKGSGKGN